MNIMKKTFFQIMLLTLIVLISMGGYKSVSAAEAGISFATAPLVEPGSHEGDILSGESKFYKFSVKKGQEISIVANIKREQALSGGSTTYCQWMMPRLSVYDENRAKLISIYSDSIFDDDTEDMVISPQNTQPISLTAYGPAEETGEYYLSITSDWQGDCEEALAIPTRSRGAEYEAEKIEKGKALFDVTIAIEGEGTGGYNLVRAINGSKVYKIINNKRLWIPTAEVFIAMGYDWSDIRNVSESEINQYARLKLAKLVGDPRVYYLTGGGFKRYIPSADVFNSYGNKWEDIIEITADELNAYPDVILIKAEGDYKVYQLENNKKRWIKTMEAFNKLGYNWNEIAPVNITEINIYITGITIE